MLTGAWWSVTSSTIQNCWTKAGLVKGKPENAEQVEEDDTTGELWSEVAEVLPVDSVTFDDYVQCDEATRTSAELTNEDILQSVQDDEGSEDDMNDGVGASEGAAAALEDCDEPVTTADVLDSLRKLRTFLGKSRTATEAVHRNVDELECFVLQSLSCTHQKKITDFFK